VSPLRRWVVRSGFALAALGPVGGALALLYGNIALWGADIPDNAPDVVRAGILLGTWGTVGCIGLLLASPLRLFASLGVQRDAWWGWPLLAFCAIVGLADLSFGIVHTGLIMWLWGKEGPSDRDGDKPGAAIRTDAVTASH
jgi:hypothetical protein